MNNINKKNIFLIWSCVTLFYCFQYVLRLLPNIMMPKLMSKFGIDSADFGSYAGIYYVGYILFHLPIGIAIAKYRGNIVLALCVVIATLGIVPICLSSSWNMIMFGRFLTGIGSSAAILGAFQFLRVASPQTFTRNLGLVVCFGLITAVYLMKPLTNLILENDFTLSVYIILTTGFVISALCLYILPTKIESRDKRVSFQEIVQVILNKKLILISVLSGLMVGPLEGFTDAWGSGFLKSLYNIDEATSNGIISNILLGMCIGSIILPYLADLTKLFYQITLASGVLMLICFLTIMYLGEQISHLNILCLAIGIGCAYQTVILSKITNYVSKELSATAASIANMIIMFFGFIIHNMIGRTMQLRWEGISIGGQKIYSKEAYIAGISVIPLFISLSVVGFSIFLLIKHFYSSKKQAFA